MKKDKYKVTNWSEYNKVLVNRGDITIWVSEEAAEQWYNETKSGKKGASDYYSDLAIKTCLTLRFLYKLTLRAAEGFSRGLMKLMGLTVNIPNYTTLCRRQKSMQIKFHTDKEKIRDLVIDSTGLKVYGEGEWKVRKHGVSKRRTWRKLHLAVDADTHEVMAMELTENSSGDAEVLPGLLKQIEGDIMNVSADGAYDTKHTYHVLEERDINPVIPPRKNAQKWHDQPPEHPRNKAIDYINKSSREEWKIEAGYHCRSLAETAMFRFKTLLGDALQSRLFASQKVESMIKVDILNKITLLGMPVSVRIN